MDEATPNADEALIAKLLADEDSWLSNFLQKLIAKLGDDEETLAMLHEAVKGE